MHQLILHTQPNISVIDAKYSQTLYILSHTLIDTEYSI